MGSISFALRGHDLCRANSALCGLGGALGEFRRSIRLGETRRWTGRCMYDTIQQMLDEVSLQYPGSAGSEAQK